jgi:hypothetical protein
MTWPAAHIYEHKGLHQHNDVDFPVALNDIQLTRTVFDEIV